MERARLAIAAEKIAKKVTACYDKLESAVISRYQKIEDSFVQKYLIKEGETLDQAKKRLKQAGR